MGITANDVTNKRFNPTKFSNGYDLDEVDDFLDEVVAYLKALKASENYLEPPFSIADKKFSSTKWREGYNQDEVDDFLDEIELGIKELHTEVLHRKALKEKFSKETFEGAGINESTGDANVEEKVSNIIKVLLGEYAYVTDQKKEEIKQIITS